MQNYVDFLHAICRPPSRLSVIFESYLKIGLPRICWGDFNEDKYHNVSFRSELPTHDIFTSIGILFRSVPISMQNEELDHYFHAYLTVDEESSLHACRRRGQEFNLDVLGVMPQICFESDVGTFEIAIERGKQRSILASMIETESKMAFWSLQKLIWQQ